MSPLVLLLIPLAIVATAVLSGIFGMGGGMILMGVYAWVLPVPAAMVLHGATQLVSNGTRAFLLRRYVHWPVLGGYLLGCAAAMLVFVQLAVVADRATVFVAMGSLPLLVALLPRTWVPTIETRWAPTACGVVCTAAHLTAGVSGPLLDAFFLRSSLDRRAVIGTKAITQTLAHLLKILYFGALIGDGAAWSELPVWLFPTVAACAVLGTWIGRQVLERVSDDRFRRWSTALVIVISVAALVKGLA